MDTHPDVNVDQAMLDVMNAKAIENEFFTPDHAYIDLGLFKDFALGVVYNDLISVKKDPDAFAKLQEKLLAVLPQYDERQYDSTEKWLGPLGYSDAIIGAALADPSLHDGIFLTAPVGNFLNTLIRHTMRNVNHSQPANKFTRVVLDGMSKSQYTLDPIAVTYHINTFPLTLSPHILGPLGMELGEALGVNIRFLNKDPALFDQGDWDTWMEKIDCFYLDSLGKFGNSEFTRMKQHMLAFMGCFIFARKRFETYVMKVIRPDEYDQEVSLLTGRISFLSDFTWLTPNDVNLIPPPPRVETIDIDEDIPK